MPDFTEVYREYFAGVYRYALRLCGDPTLAEEITQETFFKALKALDSFRGQCRLYVWLCQIAKNTYFTYLKKHREPENQALRTDSPEEGLLQKESAFAIHQILHTLPEPTRRSFPCGCWENCPSGRSALSSARRKTGPGSPTTGPD